MERSVAAAAGEGVDIAGDIAVIGVAGRPWVQFDVSGE